MVTRRHIFDSTSRAADKARPHLSGSGYQRLRRTVVFATATVAILPLVIMAVMNYGQYERTLHTETVQGASRLLTSNKRSIEFFLGERRSALSYIIRDRSFEDLRDAKVLARIIRNMNQSFAVGAFVDLGLIDSKGKQLCYKGPFDLGGRDYREQDWFHKVSQRGVFTSDVFLGHRNLPHFAIATRHELGEDDYYILRATIDAEMLLEQILTAGLTPRDDVFLINRTGILQTPSRRYGAVLETVPFQVPHFTTEVEVVEDRDQQGTPVLVGYAHISDSPFILMFVRPRRATGGGSLPRAARLFGFLAVSVALILVVVPWGSRQFVRRLRAENLRRAAMMHNVEYSNKLASIGRLAAGVAHEINNPLAVVNEKAGLLKDIVTLEGEFPRRDKIMGLVDSVLLSVNRCKKITHRLLGFARHMDVQPEAIEIRSLLQEVVGFLAKEAEYRDIQIGVDGPENIPTIESDRGQLQQVFLNILNNAIAAVKDGGHIDVSFGVVENGSVSVTISDDGVGIPRQNLERIFEPFFTTKEGSGTGLGLSITYGIVKKLGGDVRVESQVGVGTRFTVFLPAKGEG